MNKEELEAQSLFNQMQKKEALLSEFNNLRPNWKSSAIRFIGMMAAIGYLVWMYPEIMEQPVLYVLLLMIFGVSSEIHQESKRINKRIDALHRLFQGDV